MVRISLSRFTIVLLLTISSGCTAVTDLDRFKDACEGDLSQHRNLSAELHNMAQFVPNNDLTRARIELRIASIDENPEIVARAIIEGSNPTLEQDMVKVFMPRAIPPGEHKIHLYVDANRNFRYDRIEDDEEITENEPSWIASVCNSGFFNFTANDAFQDLTDPEPRIIGRLFGLQIKHFHPHIDGNQKLEMLVFHEDHAVGYYRRADIDATDFITAIPGIIIPQELYRIDLYADKNQNGIYDGFPSDHSWRLERTGGVNGILETWEHTGVFQDVEF